MATADLSASPPPPSTPDPAAQGASPGASDSAQGPLGPDGRPRFRLGPLYLTLPLANIALMLVWLGVGGFLVPLQVTMIKGRDDPNALKNAVAVGAALAAVGNPIFGQISDRTRLRSPRRRRGGDARQVGPLSGTGGAQP